LLAGILTSKVAGVALSYWLHPFRPRFCVKGGHDLFHFSKWMLLNNILIFVNNRGIDFVVGKMIGAQALGLYSVAYEISNLPTTELVFPISRAVFPGYSKLAGDVTALREAFLQVISLVALVTVPAGLGIAVVAEPLVRVVLGDKWIEAVPLIQILAAFGVCRALQGPTGAIYLAVGKPRVIAYLQMLHISTAIVLLVWLLGTYGLIGAPWAILAATALSTPSNYLLLMRELLLPLPELMGVLWRPLLSAAVMVAGGVWIQSEWQFYAAISSTLAQLLLLIVAGAAAYIGVILISWRLAGCPEGAERSLVAEIKKQRAK